LPKKSKLEILKGNVDAQELRLQEALNSLEAAKTHTQDEQQVPAPYHSSDSDINREAGSHQISSSWDILERIIGLEGDLLSSYREYAGELEKHVKRQKKEQTATDC
jgi:hypothetical protein